MYVENPRELASYFPEVVDSIDSSDFEVNYENYMGIPVVEQFFAKHGDTDWKMFDIGVKGLLSVMKNKICFYNKL